MPQPTMTVVALAIDCADPAALSDFWHQLLGGELRPDPSGDVELVAGSLMWKVEQFFYTWKYLSLP